MIFPVLKQTFGQISNETASPLYYLTFINNFDFIKKGLPDASNLGVLWSVAIEEQFYFVWPLVVFIFPVRKLWIPFLIIISGSLLFRALNDSTLLHEYHTLSCIGDMAIGATGAWLVNISEKIKRIIRNLSRTKILIVYLAFAFMFFFREKLLFEFYVIRIFERMLLALTIILIILEQTYSKKSFFKMSKFKTLTKLGNITYGLYCFHFIGILIAITLTRIIGINNHFWEVVAIETPLALMITIIISKASYKYFETPFLKLKNRFSYITK